MRSTDPILLKQFVVAIEFFLVLACMAIHIVKKRNHYRNNLPPKYERKKL